MLVPFTSPCQNQDVTHACITIITIMIKTSKIIPCPLFTTKIANRYKTSTIIKTEEIMRNWNEMDEKPFRCWSDSCVPHKCSVKWAGFKAILKPF